MKHKLFCRDCEAKASTHRIRESELPEGWTDANPHGMLVNGIREHQATCPVHNDNFDHQPPQDDDDEDNDESNDDGLEKRRRDITEATRPIPYNNQHQHQ